MAHELQGKRKAFLVTEGAEQVEVPEAFCARIVERFAAG
jgi:hypothetical protein